MPGSGGSSPNKKKILATLAEPWSVMECSVRLANSLKALFGNSGTLRQVVGKKESEYLSTPNLGRRSVNELKELLAQRGLKLGMEIPSLFEPKPKPKHELPIVGGLDQAKLKNWVVDIAAGDVENLQFQVGKGALDVSLLMRTELRRQVAKSAQTGQPFKLTLENMKIEVTFDPATQKGSIRFIF